MRLLSKLVNPLEWFCVEEYSEEEKEFFLSLGFKERIFKIGLQESKALEYKGVGPFNSWTKEEKLKIFNAVFKKFGDISVEKFEI